MRGMKRREFVSLLGGAATAWPLVTRAQQAATPVIGFLGSASPSDRMHLVSAFRQGLKGEGFTEGQNVTITGCSRLKEAPLGHRVIQRAQWRAGQSQMPLQIQQIR